MSVLDEVKEKRDYSQYRKDCGEVGYDPAIDFYNRIIAEMEMLELNLQNAIKLLKQYDRNMLSNPYPELCEYADRYGLWLEKEQRIETLQEITERVVGGFHKSHLSFDPSAR